jgi:hypothetical protein
LEARLSRNLKSNRNPGKLHQTARYIFAGH